MELATALARAAPRLPVIITSGFISDQMRQRAGELRIGALLQKEYTLERLAGIVHAVLEQHRGMTGLRPLRTSNPSARHDRDPFTAPCGTWPSPITAAPVVATGGRTAVAKRHRWRSDVYWVGGQRGEGGRNTLLRERDGSITELTPGRFDRDAGALQRAQPRTRIRRRRLYGGRRSSIFPILPTTCVYAMPPATTRRAPLTRDGRPAFRRLRRRPRAPAPDRRARGARRRPREPANELVALAPTAADDALVAGRRLLLVDPRCAGRPPLAWLSWDHPRMPWHGTELWLADIGDDGSLARARAVAGGAERIDVPARMVAGRRAALRLGPQRLVEPVPTARRPARGPVPDGGRIRPAAVDLRHATYGFALGRSRSSARYIDKGVSRLARLTAGQRRAGSRSTSRTRKSASCAWATAIRAVFVGGAPTLPTCDRRASTSPRRGRRCWRSRSTSCRDAGNCPSRPASATRAPTAAPRTPSTTRRATATTRPDGRAAAADRHQPRRPDRHDRATR